MFSTCCVVGPNTLGPWVTLITIRVMGLLLFTHEVESDSATSWTAARQASLSFTISWSLLKLMSIELVIPSNYLILCCLLLLLPSIFPSIRVFPNESAPCSGGQSIEASASVLPVTIQGWFTLGLKCFDFLAVHKTLKSLLQHHNLKAWILWHSAFFMVQLSHLYMTTKKTVTLTMHTFIGIVMSLLFNMLSRFIIAFLPRSKGLLILWLQSPSTVILEPKKIKSTTVSTFSPSICKEEMGPDTMILVFWMLNFKPTFHSSLSPSSRSSLVPCHFLLLNGIICISEVADITSGSLDSSLWFIQPGIFHEVLCI